MRNPEARIRGFSPGRFSFNTAGGRCEACEGQGMQRIEMNFLPDVQVLCDVCGGRRFNPETLGILFKGKSIGETLAMSSRMHWSSSRPSARTPSARLLADVGLGYLSLGQPSPTLSGGESQRIKLVTELAKCAPMRSESTWRGAKGGIPCTCSMNLRSDCIWPTSKADEGAASADRRGQYVVVIEHNLDVMAEADWIVDLGPEGGAGGGRIVAQGSPTPSPASRTRATPRAYSQVPRGARHTVRIKSL